MLQKKIEGDAGEGKEDKMRGGGGGGCEKNLRGGGYAGEGKEDEIITHVNKHSDTIQMNDHYRI